jgi:hypothetical protein
VPRGLRHNPGAGVEKRLPSRFGDHALRNNDIVEWIVPAAGGNRCAACRKGPRDLRQGYVSVVRVQLTTAWPPISSTASRSSDEEETAI